jgi:hypothetical protein
MSGVLLPRLIEFALQTAILLGLLWGMIKFQKLDQKFKYNFLWLLGSAALATGLDQILQLTLGHFIGIYFAAYISTPIVVAVLLLCIKKVTQAPYVDVLFTVAISYALLFGVNLFILESLMDDLRPSARNSDEFEIVAPRQEIKKEYPTVIKTNLPAPKTNTPAPVPATNLVKPAAPATAKTNPPAPGVSTNLVKPAEKTVTPTNLPASAPPAMVLKPAEKVVPRTNLPPSGTITNAPKPAKEPAPTTNSPAPIASTNLVKLPEAAAAKTNPPAQTASTNAASSGLPKPVEVIAKYFVIKGVTQNAAKSAVTMQVGTKIYTIFLGETAMTQTPDGPIPVRFTDLGEDWIVLEFNGEPAKFPIH